MQGKSVIFLTNSPQGELEKKLEQLQLREEVGESPRYSE